MISPNISSVICTHTASVCSRCSSETFQGAQSMRMIFVDSRYTIHLTNPVEFTLPACVFRQTSDDKLTTHTCGVVGVDRRSLSRVQTLFVLIASRAHVRMKLMLIFFLQMSVSQNTHTHTCACTRFKWLQIYRALFNPKPCS